MRKIVRRYQTQDLPKIVEIMRELHGISFMTQLPHMPFDAESTLRWLIGLYTNERYMCFVQEADGELTAAVGVTCYEHFQPPWPRLMREWCLWGTSAKAVALVWKEAKAWGKAHGAVLANRAILRGKHEDLTWEVLS